MLGLTSLIALWTPRIMAQIGPFVATKKGLLRKSFQSLSLPLSWLLVFLHDLFSGLALGLCFLTAMSRHDFLCCDNSLSLSCLDVENFVAT